MNTDSLEMFVEVARLRSFASVARKQNLDPSSVSRIISALEAQLGIRLFQRTTRQVTLTEAGEIYLNRISPLLHEFQRALDEARKVGSEPNGCIKITASVAFGQLCLLPHIPEFKARYPDINIEFLLTDTVVDLVKNGVDLACRLGSEVDSGLIGTRLFDTRYAIYVSPDYYRSQQEIYFPEDLETHRCVVSALPGYRSRWVFRDRESNVTDVRITSSIAMSSALALREAAISGMGPALLADWLVRDDVARGNLVRILNEYEVTAKNFDTAAWLLYPSRDYLPNKTRVMIDFLKEKYADYRK